MSDPVIQAFRRRTLVDDLPRVQAEGVGLHLRPDPTSGDPPRHYHGLFTSVERFVPDAGGTFRIRGGPLPFSIDLPDDYCSCCDGTLQLRVARVGGLVAHPNIGPGGLVCLGPTFRPSTRLGSLLDHVYRICTARIYASHSPWDVRTADFYRRNADRVRTLRSAPLWKRAVASRVRVEPVEPRAGAEQ